VLKQKSSIKTKFLRIHSKVEHLGFQIVNRFFISESCLEKKFLYKKVYVVESFHDKKISHSNWILM